jgi:hypothetical protein
MTVAFKYGRKTPSNTPAIALKSILRSAVSIPPHPVSEDALAQLSGWQMLGNDTYGDCVAVTWANERKIISTILGGKPTYPTLSQVYSLYKTQNPNFPNDDNGMDIQTCLSYLVKNGGPDGVKPVAFAKVDVTNLEEVKAALAIFGMVWVGINVLNANMDEFNNGQPWDFVSASALDGGHSVVAGGYLGTASNDVRFITWAQETGFTDAFWAHQAEEAWVVIWPEHLGTKQFQQGIDQQALASAYTALTGRTFPVQPTPTPTPVPTPTPTPVPVPTPTPVPVPVDPRVVAFYNAVRVWAHNHHTGSNARAAKAAIALFKAEGLE